ARGSDPGHGAPGAVRAKLERDRRRGLAPLLHSRHVGSARPTIFAASVPEGVRGRFGPTSRLMVLRPTPPSVFAIWRLLVFGCGASKAKHCFAFVPNCVLPPRALCRQTRRTPLAS